VEGFVERSPSVLFVRLGPEQPQEGVAAMEPLRFREGQIGQKGSPLRLCQDRQDAATILAPKLHRTEEEELDH
jgi:hypothetical protein